MPEERIESSLLQLRKDCEERMNEFADAQNQLLSEIRQKARKERKHRQDKEREEKERSAREVSEKRKSEKERAERENKERRRVSREDRRLRKEEQERLAVVTGKREGMKTVAAKEKKTEAIRKQRHKVVMKSVKVRTKDEDAEKGSVRTKATKHAAEASKFPSHKNKKSTTVSLKSDGETKTFQKGKSIEETWTAFEDELPFSPQHEEANYIDNGCLTQRLGLDIPTPKSRLSHDGNIDEGIGERGRNTRARPNASSSTCKPQHRRTGIKDGSPALESKENTAGKFMKNEIKSSMQKRKSEKSEDIRLHIDEASRKTKRASSRRSSQESRNSFPRKRAITATTSEKHKMSSTSLDGGKKEILQKKNQRSVSSIGLSKKDEKTKSDLSIGTKGSYRSSSSRKRSRQEITEPAQSYGISSGERLSKSRRRKPQGSDHTLRKAKSVGIMGNDFNFNF
mmetsp:Transcript_16509/g.24961  ORF Transcript_16509/g.24961 Transcript_16509/m.24961 type:complete len:454 (-) Transcript_16509:1478-2839(-)